VEINRGAPVASNAIRYPAGFRLPLKPVGTRIRPSAPKNSPKGFPGMSAPRDTHARKNKRKNQMEARLDFIVSSLGRLDPNSRGFVNRNGRSQSVVCPGAPGERASLRFGLDQMEILSNGRANQGLLRSLLWGALTQIKRHRGGKLG